MGTVLRRSACLLPLLVLLVGCGGSPTTPSSPAPAPSPSPTLAAGSYYFSVAQGTNSIPIPGGSGTTLETTLCMGTGSYPTTVRVPVTLQIDGPAVSVRAVNGSLLGELSLAGGAASGVLRGSADDGAGFSLDVQGAEPASLSGTMTSAGAVDGTVIAGRIELTGPKGRGGCSPMTWSLTPRS